METKTSGSCHTHHMMLEVGAWRPTVAQKFLKQRSPNYADDSLPLAKHRCTSPMDSPGHVLDGGSHWKWSLMPPGQFPTSLLSQSCRKPSEMEFSYSTPAENHYKCSPRPQGQLLPYVLIKVIRNALEIEPEASRAASSIWPYSKE